MLLTSPDAQLNSQIELTNTIQLTSREIIYELWAHHDVHMTPSHEDPPNVELGNIRLNEEWLTLPEPYKQDVEDELSHYLDATLAKIQNNMDVPCSAQDANFLLKRYIDSRPAWLERLEADINNYLRHLAFLRAFGYIEELAFFYNKNEWFKNADDQSYPDISLVEKSPFITATDDSYTFEAKIVMYPTSMYPRNIPGDTPFDFIALDETNCYAFATVRLDWQRGG